MFVNEIFEGVNPDQGVATYQQLLLAVKENRATEIDGMTISENQAKYLLKTFNDLSKKKGKVTALEFLGSYGEIGKALHNHAINQAKQLTESLTEISDKTIDSYYDKVLKRQREHEGGKHSPYKSFERLPAKRQRGIDRATKRILRPEWDPTIDESDDGHYDERNPKIDLFHKETKKYLGSTNWYKNTSSAVRGYESKHPELKGKVIADYDRSLEEDLRKWFKEKWVRFGPDGKIRGDCARGSESEGKPKCLPQAKAHALGKKKRASAAAKKRREDPNPERKGKAKNVATKVNELSPATLQSYADKRGAQVAAMKSDNPDAMPGSPEWNKIAVPAQQVGRAKQKIARQQKHQGVAEAQTDYQKRRQRERDVDMGKPVRPLPKNPKTDYQKKREQDRRDMELGEEWSEKYKRSINCNNPKGFSQRAHCQGRKKTDESLVQVPHNGKMVTGKVVRLDKGNPESPFYVVDIGEYESIKVPTHRVKHIEEGSWHTVKHTTGPTKVYVPSKDEDESEMITTQDIHDLADSKGILWDNEPSFLKLTKHLTGKEHLDDLDQDQLKTVKQFLEKFDKYEKQLNEKQDACYHKVKSRYKVWPSAYASGALVKCRKVGAKNWGTGGKKK